MKHFILGFLAATLMAAGGYWFLSHRPTHGVSPQSAQPQLYHCPMHPTYISDKPGDCPICGMRLVPVEHAPADSHAAHSLTEPGSNSAKGVSEVAGAAAEPAGGEVDGHAAVRLSRDRLQKMGIRIEEARWTNLQDSIRTVGRVVPDETRFHHVHTKFEGFIEQIYVDYVGKFVQKGQPLFSIYSPELVATEKEYLLALRSREQIGPQESESGLPGIDLVRASRERLRLWDISADQIAQIEKTREPIEALTIYSPVTGFVSAKTALQGVRVTPADSLYDIVDLSAVWVLADVYEINLPLIRLGQPAEVTLAYQPGRVWKGRVTYIYPNLEEQTRTAKVRLEFANPNGDLKPEMYVDVELKASLGKTLAVPESAVLSTGERAIVYVARGGGLFEPREVTPGVKVRNFYEIKKGLTAGEKVAAGANFLLDSESKLRATLSDATIGPQHAH